MVIETKYDIGDEVWVCGCDRAFSATIVELRCRVNNNGVFDVYYDLISKEYTQPFSCPQELIYPTKEELLKSL